MRCKTSFLIAALFLLPWTTPSVAEQPLTFTLEPTANLPDLITEALRSNPEILADRMAVEAARARIVQARSLDDPELSFESWSIPLNQPTNVNQADNHMVNLRQRFPFPGKLRLRGEVERSDRKSVV